MTKEEMSELLDKVKDHLRYYLDHHVQYYPGSEETWSHDNSYVYFEVDCYNDSGLGAEWTEVWCIDSDGKITVDNEETYENYEDFIANW